MTQNLSELLKISGRVSGNFSLYRKILLFFYDMTQKKFRIAHKFPDSNATLLQGFFSLCMVDLPDTMVEFPDTVVDLPDTIVDLPDYMLDLHDTMVNLPDTMVDLP